MKNLSDLQEADPYFQEIIAKVQLEPDKYAFKFHLQQDYVVKIKRNIHTGELCFPKFWSYQP
jgi:hypothetical protein